MTISTTCTCHHYGSTVLPYHNNVVLYSINADGMDETYGTYVDDECFDIHDYDDDTDDDTDDDNDHKKDSYTAAGAAPDAGALQDFFGGEASKAGPRAVFGSRAHHHQYRHQYHH